MGGGAEVAARVEAAVGWEAERSFNNNNNESSSSSYNCGDGRSSNAERSNNNHNNGDSSSSRGQGAWRQWKRQWAGQL